MKISTNVFKPTFVLAVASLLVMGQSCSIPFLGSKQDATDGGIFRSDDHGQSWKQKNVLKTSKGNSTLRNVSVRTLVPDPQVQDRWLVGTVGQGVYLTKNAGESWESTSLKTGDFSCIAFQPTDHEVIYATAGTSIVKSINGGKNWKTIYSDTQGAAMGCIIVSPQAPLTIFGITTNGKVLQSIDGGKNWTLLLTTRSISPRLMLVSPNAEQLTVFGKTQGIFVIDIVHASWQDISKSLKDFVGAKTIRSVSALETPKPLWYIATSYGLLRSVDHGATWQPIKTLDTPGTVAIQNVVVNPQDTNELFISVGKKIERTSDGGATWTVSSVSTSRSLVQLQLDPTNIDRLFVATFTTQ